MLVTSRSAPFVLAAALTAAACAGSRELEGGVYREGPIAFRVASIPDGWRRLDMHDAALAFRDDAHQASILINARCNPDDQGTPLASLTEHLIMGTTERDYRLEETIPFDAREARHTVLRAKLDGVLMAYDIFVMKKDGCVYDLVYVSPPDSFDSGAPAFDRFARNFHTLPGSGAT